MICELFSVPPATAREVLADPSGIHDLLETLDDEGSGVSLEKSWHGLHFTLTGSAEGGDPPLNFLLIGGTPVGDEDVGYGPARILDPDEVVALNGALAAISDEEFARRFDLGELAEADVYPSVWDEPLEDLLEEFGAYFDEAKAIVERAAAEGEALLIVIR